MDFPAQTVKVDKSKLLQSLEFAEQLVHLHENPMIKYEEFIDQRKQKIQRAFVATNYVRD